jgi:hypothetical protein
MFYFNYVSHLIIGKMSSPKQVPTSEDGESRKLKGDILGIFRLSELFLLIIQIYYP